MEPLSRWPHRTPLLQGSDPSPRWQLWLSSLVDTVNLALQTVIGIGQLQFPAAENASTDPNVLDDYEEGEWTPLDVSGDSLVFPTAEGTYVKIGQLVLLGLNATYPVTASGSTATIGGFPFPVRNTTNSLFSASVVTNSGLAFSGVLPANTSRIVFVTNAFVGITNAQLSGTLVISTLVYRTDT